MIECVNCGAKISEDDVRCPYCSAMQYEAAQEQYMERLYSIEENMDRLDDTADKNIFRKVARNIIITLAAAVLVVVTGIALGYLQYRRYYDSDSDKKTALNVMSWYDTDIGYVEECYRNRDFASITDRMNSEYGHMYFHKALRNWEHYPVCMIYSEAYSDFDEVMPENAGEHYERYDFGKKYRGAVKTAAIRYVDNSQHRDRYSKCTAEDRQIVDAWINEAEEFLTGKTGISAESVISDINDMYNENGYYEYSKIQEYQDKYYEAYLSR